MVWFLLKTWHGAVIPEDHSRGHHSGVQDPALLRVSFMIRLAKIGEVPTRLAIGENNALKLLVVTNLPHYITRECTHIVIKTSMKGSDVAHLEDRLPSLLRIKSQHRIKNRNGSTCI